MKQTRWYIHPIFVFVLSTVALAISLILYIYWYVSVSAGLKSVIQRYQLDPDQFIEANTWVVILVLSLLVGIILAGILIIFIYSLKILHLYRLQHNFINNFTHELKTPVTSLKLYLETFARHEIPREEELKYIGFMLQDVERLSGNISSILNLARIESGVYKGEFTPVNLVEFVQGFLVGNRHLFRDCDIRVENPADKQFFYPVIASLFEILLMNLLINAIKYNVSGKPEIHITFEQDEKRLLIRFRDNGIGIEKKERKKIFKKFYQGRRHEEHIPVGGSGIGLYLVQHIARLHRGKITADSKGPGKGAIFTLRLPHRMDKREKP
ncbi:MAG: HAMP domain-containing histidine kinase [Deltaproteobacteria bacterium]|nr:HAMP domain-containing histidine kinase [Deltaproteobacteria bacterium]